LQTGHDCKCEVVRQLDHGHVPIPPLNFLNKQMRGRACQNTPREPLPVSLCEFTYTFSVYDVQYRPLKRIINRVDHISVYIRSSPYALHSTNRICSECRFERKGVHDPTKSHPSCHWLWETVTKRPNSRPNPQMCSLASILPRCAQTELLWRGAPFFVRTPPAPLHSCNCPVSRPNPIYCQILLWLK
jgi:hypothetical protein